MNAARRLFLCALCVSCPSCTLLIGLDDLGDLGGALGDAMAGAEGAGDEPSVDARSAAESSALDGSAEGGGTVTDGSSGAEGGSDATHDGRFEGASGDGPLSDQSTDVDGSPGAADGGDASDAADGAPPPCGNDLSYVGAGDFTVAFTLTSTSHLQSALLNQRSVCNPSTFWDVRLNQGTDGEVVAQIDDGTNLVDVGSAGGLNDGVPHAIIFGRSAGSLSLEVDGVVQGMTPGTPSTTVRLGYLPAIRVGSDVCDGQDGTQPLAGAVTAVCIWHQ